MSKDYYGVGIQGGGGWWAGMHINAYLAHPKTNIVALCDPRVDEVKARVVSLGLSCRVYSDIEKMLNDEDVDIVSICSPPYLHARDTILAMQAGKHVLVEKPIATTLDDLVQMKKTANAAGCKTMAGFVLRWNGMIKTLKAMMNDKAIGAVFLVQTDFWQNVGRLDIPMNKWLGKKSIAGSSLLNGGCHAMDIVRWLLGAEVVETFSYSVNGGSPQYEYNPTIVALMKLDSGAVCKLTSTLEPDSPYLFRIELLGTQGTIRNNLFYTSRWPGQLDYTKIPLDVPGGPAVEDPMKGEIAHFIDCIDNDVESHVNLLDAIKTHEALLAADISSEEGRPVKLPLI